MGGAMVHWWRESPRTILGTILLLFVLAIALAGLILLERPAAAAVGTNPSLNAFAYAMPNRGWAPLTVYVSPFGSGERSGTLTRFEWDLDGDGQFETDATSKGGYAEVLYTEPRTYTATLRVTDEQGQTATASTAIVVRHPASSSVDYSAVFDDSRVRPVELRLTQANRDALWSDPGAKRRVEADVILFGEQIRSVAVSIKGNSSLTVPGLKKSYKIDLDYYIAGQEYRNVKQLLLHNNFADASMLREKMAYDMMHFAGVPAGHTAYVTLSVDIVDDDQPPVYLGVYTLVERVDAKFLGNNLGRDQGTGNLYKADAYFEQGAADLAYYGEDILDYPRPRGELAYHLQTNLDDADYAGLVELARVIDGVDYAREEDFAAALEQVFNIDGYLRYLAVIFTNLNLDTYPYTGNNFYLYDNPSTGKFEFLPWDLNNSWGHFGGAADFGLYGEPCCLGPLEWAPLFTRVFQVEAYRRAYAAYVDLLVRNWFNNEYVSALAAHWQGLIEPYLDRGDGDKMYVGPEAQFTLDQFSQDRLALVALTQARSEYLRRVLESGEWRTQIPDANTPPAARLTGEP